MGYLYLCYLHSLYYTWCFFHFSRVPLYDPVDDAVENPDNAPSELVTGN